jgi:7-cyano-7-deazaguanine synthase in queuosine biosynthesis
MNEITVTTVVEAPFHSGAGVYLRLAGQEPVKLSFNIEEYARARGTFDALAGEFAYFCAVIYGCDRLIARDSGSGDRWTREMAVQIPVNDPARWEDCKGTVEKMLDFLTGDIWRLAFVRETAPLFGSSFRKIRRNFRTKKRVNGAAVSLFSGGLDSIMGIVDWLEENPNTSLVLASSYDAHAENAKADQERLLHHLRTEYPGRSMRFVARSGLQTKGKDINFRSRSLTFLGNAILAASFVGDGTRILIPENGAIALNFPLSPARSGSLSTRTVHPYFIQQFNQLLCGLGFSHSVDNPYRFLTKGEILAGCKNKPFLHSVYQESVSCGKRGFSRMHWHDKRASACGHCVPCIFRQSAVRFAGLADEHYGCTIANRSHWGTSDLLKPNSDLQTVIDFIQSDVNEESIWRRLRANGHLERERKSDYVNLILRLRSELESWLQSLNLV